MWRARQALQEVCSDRTILLQLMAEERCLKVIKCENVEKVVIVASVMTIEMEENSIAPKVLC